MLNNTKLLLLYIQSMGWDQYKANCQQTRNASPKPLDHYKASLSLLSTGSVQT